MKQLFKNLLLAGIFTFFIASPVATLANSQPTYAASPVKDCNAGVLGIPPWFRGLTKMDANGDCVIVSPDTFNSSGQHDGLSIFIWKIVLNGVEMALIVTAYIAFFFILYGGFLFIASGGTSAQVEKARKTVLNAIIGLVISMGAIGITNLFFGVLDNAKKVDQYGVHELDANMLIHNVLNLVYYAAGIVAVVSMIIGGLNYITSMGDSGRVARAKNMILYAVIGLIILLIAYAITNFVIGSFK